MWKKLFYDASKKVANDVSKVHGNQVKAEMVVNKKNKLIDQMKKDMIKEYQTDFEFQEMLKSTNSHLEFLIELNDTCNQCIDLLRNPLEEDINIEILAQRIGSFSSIANKFLDEAEEENDYYRDKIANTIKPFLSLHELMFGNENEDDSLPLFQLVMIYIEMDGEVPENIVEYMELSIGLILDIKSEIASVFTETKTPQLVTYSIYEESGELDFGKYSLTDLK